MKLARLAVAAAILFFSASESGETVLVEREHVEFAFQFLERLYAKPSLAFDEYAAMQTRRFEITDEVRVRTILTRHPNTMRGMMEQEQFTMQDLAELLALDDRTVLRESIGALRDAGFLRRVGSSYYVKTSGANAWLRRELARAGGAETPLGRMFANAGPVGGLPGDEDTGEPPGW